MLPIVAHTLVTCVRDSLRSVSSGSQFASLGTMDVFFGDHLR